MNKNFRRINTGIYPYNRKMALYYAKRWAFDRNPKYYNFENLGGDCTNFISQILHAGGCPMNNSKINGWYYYNLNNRSPSWTGVEFLYQFLINNKSIGPIAKLCSIEELEIGDIIQLKFRNNEFFGHSLAVVKINEPRNLDNIFISTHTYDRYNYPVSNYTFENIRFIHIIGYR